MSAKIESLTQGYIKSCARTVVDSLYIGQTGPNWDRHWMVVDAQTGKFVLSNEHPQMAKIQSQIQGVELVVSFDSGELYIPFVTERETKERVRVEMFNGARFNALDDGDEAAQWFSSILNRKVRLVHFPATEQRFDSSGFARLEFADSWALTISSIASLHHLNQQIETAGGVAVGKERFGHNIWVDGTEPYAEDEWAEIVINGLSLLVVKPVIRCARTQIRRESPDRILEKDREPLRTLSKHRRTQGGVVFGQKAAHLETGAISTGDKITIVQTKAPPVFL